MSWKWAIVVQSHVDLLAYLVIVGGLLVALSDLQCGAKTYQPPPLSAFTSWSGSCALTATPAKQSLILAEIYYYSMFVAFGKYCIEHGPSLTASVGAS